MRQMRIYHERLDFKMLPLEANRLKQAFGTYRIGLTVQVVITSVRHICEVTVLKELIGVIVGGVPKWVR